MTEPEKFTWDWSPTPSPGLNHSANVDPSFVKSPKQWAQYGIFGVNNARISYCVHCFLTGTGGRSQLEFKGKAKGRSRILAAYKDKRCPQYLA
jgi:hypothetical protein